MNKLNRVLDKSDSLGRLKGSLSQSDYDKTGSYRDSGNEKGGADASHEETSRVYSESQGYDDDEGATLQEKLFSSVAVLMLLVVFVLLGYAAFKGKDAKLAGGTMSWSLDMDQAMAAGAEAALDKGKEEGQKAVDELANGAENAGKGLGDALGIGKRALLRQLAARADDIDTSATWKFSLSLAELKANEGDPWPQAVNNTVWQVVEHFLPYGKAALTISTILIGVVFVMQVLSTISVFTGRLTSLQHPLYAKMNSILQFVAFFVGLTSCLAIAAVQSAAPTLAFDTKDSDLPFIVAKFEVDKTDWKLVIILSIALALMTAHWLMSEGWQQINECRRGRGEKKLCKNCREQMS